jgi:uncharacterized membrane protein
MKNLALCIGFFSIIMGWVNYDPEIETAVLPVVTGIIVVILALLARFPNLSPVNAAVRKVSVKRGSAGPAKMRLNKEKGNWLYLSSMQFCLPIILHFQF